MKDAHADDLSISTDGSKDEVKVGRAAVHYRLKLIKQLPDKASIYSTEMTAFYKKKSDHVQAPY